MKILNQTKKDFAGDVLLIDPCYIKGKLSDKWDEFCDTMFAEGTQGNIRQKGLLQLNGAEILYCGTAYGDGGYGVNLNGIEVGVCGVDAGLLCAVSVEDLDKICSFDQVEDAKGDGVVIKDFIGTVVATDNNSIEGSGVSMSDGRTMNFDVQTDGEDEEYENEYNEFDEEE
mgnify:CR=1 FL=1